MTEGKEGIGRGAFKVGKRTSCPRLFSSTKPKKKKKRGKKQNKAALPIPVQPFSLIPVHSRLGEHDMHRSHSQ